MQAALQAALLSPSGERFFGHSGNRANGCAIACSVNIIFPGGDWFSLTFRGTGQSVMKSIACLTAFLLLLGGYADARDMVRVERATAGKAYDYIVHVQNTYSIGYNPEVREDRNRMVLKILKGQCRAGRVVGDDKIITEIWGITSSRPDYIVLVKCA
jgi:hypothetical protein